MQRLILSLAGSVCLAACATQADVFDAALDCVATGWNVNQAKAASECFAENAIYTEPGQKQLYEGRAELFEFFGGPEGRNAPMTMEWHDRAYNPRTQTGFAEFSFAYGTYAHGVAIITLEGGEISQWREYWYESEDDWQAFTAPRKPGAPTAQ